MTVPVPSFPPTIGESGGERIARIVRFYNLCSLHNRTDELGALVARGADDPSSVVGIKTNCATFVLGCLKAAGCPSKILDRKYINGMAFAWLVEIGDAMGAWVDPAVREPTPGAVLWFHVNGQNVDHAEVLLSLPDEHGGGGRPDNAITIGHGDYHESWSRPLYRWLNPEMLSLPDAHVDTVDNGSGMV